MGLKKTLFYSKPDSDEIEVTLFGTGGGYGEAVVLKLRDSEWVIIDSCIDPETKEPLTVNYLTKIGVNVKEDVKWVICTHWHNDHIVGLSKTLNYCENAKFCMPNVNDTKKFLHFVGLDCSKIKKGSISSYNEFRDCLKIVNARGITPKRVGSDCVIYSETLKLSNSKEVNIELFSLSPSDLVVANFDYEISDLISDFGLSNVVISGKSANAKSVVIFLKYGDFSALLGADLEVKKNNNEGWKDIYHNSVIIKNKAIIYKIPHHGSVNGYDEGIYQKFVDPEAVIKLTPWNRSSKLPQPEMVNKYKNHSSNFYITSPIDVSKKPKKRDKSAEKIAKEFIRRLTEMRFKEGIVRTRHNIIKGKKGINVDSHGSAFKI